MVKPPNSATTSASVLTSKHPALVILTPQSGENSTDYNIHRVAQHEPVPLCS